MPPHPWYYGGQAFHKLFLTGEDCIELTRGQPEVCCLDVSHSYMAAKHYNFCFEKFISLVGPQVKHIHIADALPPAGEGLQILDGEMDFHNLLFSLAKQH